MKRTKRLHKAPWSMPLQQREWHAKVCSGKSRYHNRALAKVYAKAFKKHYGHHQRPYQCSICDGWHLMTPEKP